jgi:NADPH:quinone reductase
MKAVVCEEVGSLLGPGSVRIKLRVALVNPPDIYMVLGKYHVKLPPPFIPGVEGMGHVTELGEGVTHLLVGDRVMTYAGAGCFAEEIVVTASAVHAVPAGMNDRTAAGFVLVHATAYHALFDCGHVESGQTVVVLGASGGIGLAALQLAKAAGARTIAVARTPEKLEMCRRYGADVLVRNDDGLAAALREATSGRGADVMLDVVGARTTEQALRAIRPFGRYVLAGAARAELPLIRGSQIILKQAQLVGASVRLFNEREPSRAAANVANLVRMWNAGTVATHVCAEFALAEVCQALRMVEEGKSVGKVIVRIAPEAV